MCVRGGLVAVCDRIVTGASEVKDVNYYSQQSIRHTKTK